MSTLVWQPSPRSSASPQPHSMTMPGNGGPARHQVGFGHNSHAFVSQHASASGTGPPSGFGFGFGAPSPSASTSSSNGFGFGGGLRSPSSSSSYTSMPFPGNSSVASSSLRGMTLMSTPSAAGAGTTTATPGNSRRRRRSDSAEEMREDTEQVAQASESAASGKRVRREIRPVKSLANLHHQHHQMSGPGTGPSSATGTGVPPSPQNEVDIGKALAGLSKPALLTVLTSLLSQQPQLKPLVLSLLPPPSLDSFTSTLHSLERRILDALPSGGATRQEYIWSRIRAPLEDYISEARLALSQFCPSSSTLAAQGVSEDQQQQQQNHPTSTFAFLYTLTLSIRKLEAILPRAPVPFSMPTSATSATSSGANINNPSTLNQRDPLVSFLPPLYNQWHHLITKLSTSVNQTGKILSADMLRGWFRNLDTLVSIESAAAMATANPVTTVGAVAITDAGSVGRRASEAVRDRFVKELGWLVGIRQTVAPFSSAALSPHRLGNVQAMDSRMSGDNGEDTDEEL